MVCYYDLDTDPMFIYAYEMQDFVLSYWKSDANCIQNEQNLMKNARFVKWWGKNHFVPIIIPTYNSRKI